MSVHIRMLSHVHQAVLKEERMVVVAENYIDFSHFHISHPPEQDYIKNI